MYDPTQFRLDGQVAVVTGAGAGIGQAIAETFAAAGAAVLATYRDMWWVSHNAHGAYGARGVHGQTLYIDPAADMVIVRLASHPVAGNAANDPTSLPAWQALADYLVSKAGP